ncbi:ABC transporter ATP-binding protein [bacterium]|nr:ABC transporter ATP-binding protein [bacterium]
MISQAEANRTALEGDGRPVDIKCVGVTKIFRDFWMRPRVRAVDGVDLEVRRGQVYGLLGPNGSGKSTTIKMLLGLLTPTAGRIAVMGKRPRHVDTKKEIGYLPEESYLYRFLSARETLDYYGRLFRIPAPIRRERVSKLLEMVGLEAVEHRPVGEFSKGMQRRVGLAQSLINDPQLLILDEPTSGMDPVGARQIKDVIEKLAARGKTILLCTHLLSDVEDLCERVAIMFGGKVRAEGTCGELLEQQALTNLQTDRLPADALAEIEAVLAKRGLGLRSVEQPRRRLESLFLEIVDTARKEGTHTSGARSGGQIADFLRAGASEVGGDVEADGEEILDSLAAKAAVPQPAPAMPHSPVAAREEDDALADLVSRPTAPAAQDRQTQPPQAVEASTGPDEDPDDDVLASLTRR